MSAYRICFRAAGEICGREEFLADDDVAASRIARVLYDTCSDVCDSFELWQGQREIFLESQPPHQTLYVVDLIEAHQRVVRDTQERMSASKWMIARSKSLIEAVDRLAAHCPLGLTEDDCRTLIELLRHTITTNGEPQLSKLETLREILEKLEFAVGR